jgi:hypothetical protein
MGSRQGGKLGCRHWGWGWASGGCLFWREDTGGDCVQVSLGVVVRAEGDGYAKECCRPAKATTRALRPAPARSQQGN